jgi:hypothetical protein
MRVLKAEIQATLLELRGFVLNSSYPQLQATAAAPQAENPSSKQWRVQKFSVGQAKAVPSVYVEEPEDMQDVPAATHMPPFIADADMRQEMPQGNYWLENDGREEVANFPTEVFSKPARAPRIEPEPVPVEENPDTDVRAWMELEQWVSQKVKEIGVEGTRELIKLYGGKDRKLLLGFLKIHEECTDLPTVSYPVSPPELPARPYVEPEPPRPVFAEPRTTNANGNGNGSRNKNNSYRELGEPQELAMRFIADILSTGVESNSVASNGRSRR